MQLNLKLQKEIERLENLNHILLAKLQQTEAREAQLVDVLKLFIKPNEYAYYSPQELEKINKARRVISTDGKAYAERVYALETTFEVLKRIIEELPHNRDWLDPTVERMAKDAIAKSEGK